MKNNSDTLYGEYANSRYEFWFYSDGRKYYLKSLRTVQAAVDWADKNHFDLVMLEDK